MKTMKYTIRTIAATVLTICFGVQAIAQRPSVNVTYVDLSKGDITISPSYVKGYIWKNGKKW